MAATLYLQGSAHQATPMRHPPASLHPAGRIPPRPGAPRGGATFAASPGVAPEDTVLLLDEVPAQDDVLSPLRVLSAHSAGDGAPSAVPTMPPCPPGPPRTPSQALTGNTQGAHEWETQDTPKCSRSWESRVAQWQAAWPPASTGRWHPQPLRPAPDASPGEPILDVVQEALRHQRVLVQVDKMRRLGRMGGSPLWRGAGAQHWLPAWPLSPWVPDHHRPRASPGRGHSVLLAWRGGQEM